MAKQKNSPFKFLDAYNKNDKSIFFGRDQETYELYDRAFETNLVLLYGASGTGKTSLINCGLSNQFESTDWLPLLIRRKDGILESIREEIHKKAVTKQPKDSSIIELIKSLYLDYFKPVFLIFDQFEELFILADKKEQTEFFTELGNLLHAQLQCKVIISMREEYIAFLSEYEDYVPSLFDNRLRVEKMSAKNLKEVIEKTAQHFGITLKNNPQSGKSVSEKILDKLRDKHHEIDLANLQVYLDRLYQKDVDRHGQGKQRIFDNPLIESTGDLEDVMDSFIEAQVRIIEEELKAKKGNSYKGVPLNVLFELVTDNGTKQAVDVETIKKRLERSKSIAPDVIDYCIKRFREMRILRELTE